MPPWIDNYVCDENAQSGAFDKELLQIDGLTWLPWVGRLYHEGGLLVIGESDYAKRNMATDNETPCQHIMGDRNFIRKVVDRFGIHADGWNPTIGNIRSVLLRKGDCACDSFFRIAFMDFCQRAIAREDGDSSNEHDFIAGLPVVKNAIKVLKPSVVLIVGVKSAKFVHNQVEIVKVDSSVNGCYPWMGTIEGIDCVFIRHPGQYFVPSIWRDFLHEHYGNRIVVKED